MYIMGFFTEHEQMALLEIARVAIADADTFDEMTEKLDLSDEVMVKLREKVQEVMDTDKPLPKFTDLKWLQRYVEYVGDNHPQVDEFATESADY